MRPVSPDPEVINFLWSIDGKLWSRTHIRGIQHGLGIFADIKDDHECGTDDQSWICDNVLTASGSFYDPGLQAELRIYGISGVPKEWKEHR